MEVYIDAIKRETSSIKRFKFKPVNSKQLPIFSAGSHIKLGFAGLQRRYSLISDPENREFYEIAVKLTSDSTGGSSYLHHQAAKGERMQVSFPKNYFPISPSATHHVFYAAGIGITPFLSMMNKLKRGGESFELHYAARSEEECAFYEYLIKHFPDQVHFYFSSKKCRLTEEFLYDHLIGTHIYLCGPPSFISSFNNTALDIGYPTFNIHYEHFSSPVLPSNSQPFTVLLNNGDNLSVREGVSILDTLLSAGYPVPYSCKIGRCGTCELKVKSGSILHLDDVLSVAEKQRNESIITCVSRCKERFLELDI